MPAQVPAPPGLPPFYTLTVPVDWRAVDFISDLHLSAALPRTFDAWAAHLLHTDADAVFILGDLFEAWVGDDMRSLPFEHRCVDVMAEAASRRQIGLMVGNRDFLVGAAMREACGLIALPDPTVLDAWGQRLLLTHGDALCLDDTAYQAFRAESRGEAWQRAFLSLSLVERMRRVALVREQSDTRRKVEPFDAKLWADVDTAAAVSWLHATGAAEMVHGHTHRPGSEDLAPGYRRHVLSDWDLDHAQPGRAEVLRLTRDGLQRRHPVAAP